MLRIRCRGVVFDLDGTLIDTHVLKVKNAGLAFENILQCDVGKVERAYKQHSGVPRRALFDSIALAVTGQHLDDVVFTRISNEFSALNQASIGPQNIFADVADTLSKLRSRGFALALSSAATPEEVYYVTRVTGLQEHFVRVLGSENGFNKGREHIAHLCALCELEPCQVCLVGDEPADIDLAKKAGAHCIAREGTYQRDELARFGPDAVIGTIDKLADILVFG